MKRLLNEILCDNRDVLSRVLVFLYDPLACFMSYKIYLLFNSSLDWNLLP
jgi:hypothetical protein